MKNVSPAHSVFSGKQCEDLGYSVGKEWERKKPEGTFLLDSHIAIWWKPCVFVFLRFSAHTFVALFCATPCVRSRGSR